MTLQDALVSYRTCARAEGKSPKTVAWGVSSVGYFAEFLSTDQQDIGTITGNDLRLPPFPWLARIFFVISRAEK